MTRRPTAATRSASPSPAGSTKAISSTISSARAAWPAKCAEPPMSSNNPHRRRLLALLISSPWLAAAAQGLSAGAAGEKFMALSKFATGRAELDADIGAALFAVFPHNLDALGADAASGKYRDVEALEAAVRGTPKHDALLALISAWYTGSVTVNGKERFVTLSGALMYGPIAEGSHIPGQCAGAVNSWADLPYPALERKP